MSQTMTPISNTDPELSDARRVGYVGVDVLNNATICNEAAGLLEMGVPLAIGTVKTFERATFNEGLDELAAVREAMISVGSMSKGRRIFDVILAPLRFPAGFWKMTIGGLFTPCEGLRQKAAFLSQIIPAICMASEWRRLGYDIRHLHSHWAHTATGVALHLSRLLGVGFSMTGHANDLFVHRVALKAKVRSARFIHCIAEYHRLFYLSLGASAGRLPVIYCGIDTRRFDARAFGPPSKAERAFVGVGRLVEKKGFHHLIEACRILKGRGIDFRCEIAGSGPEEKRLREMVARLDVGDRVSITGSAVPQAELPALLGRFRFMALPCVKDSDGDMDGLPQVLMESMACGRPAVSTKLVGIPDLVRHERDGLLVESENVPELAAALERMLADDGLVDRLGVSGAEFVNRYFDRESNVRKVAELFSWAISNPGHEAPPERLVFPPAPGAREAYGPDLFKAAQSG
jgi:glycosyltransferase involved in cell wall biosynthesis